MKLSLLLNQTMATLFLCLALGVDVVYAQAKTAEHPGYLSSVEEERYRVAKVVVIMTPEQEEETSLQDRIFTDKLTKEFQLRYEDRFGRTQTEQFVTVSSRYMEVDRDIVYNRTVEENAKEQQRFASFMMKRLTEYHVDNYMRSNPSVRPMYELKEKMSNLNLQVRKNYRVKVKYSLSSNDLDVYLENPYQIENRLSRRGSNETAVVLGYPITDSVTLRSDYVLENSNFVVSAVKKLNQEWSTSITGSKGLTSPTPNEVIQEEKVLLGLSWRG